MAVANSSLSAMALSALLVVLCACPPQLYDEDKLADHTVACVLTPSAVHDKPVIIAPCLQCTPVTPVTALAPDLSASSTSLPIPNEDHGDLLICGLWSSATNCIWMSASPTWMPQSTNLKNAMKVLASHEKEKKKKYLAPCLAQCCHCTPSIVSADGLLGHEASWCCLWFVSWLSNLQRNLRNLTQWFVTLCALALALPFFMPPTAFFDAPIFPLAVWVSPVLNGSMVVHPWACTLSTLYFLFVSFLSHTFPPSLLPFFPSVAFSTLLQQFSCLPLSAWWPRPLLALY